VVVPRIRQLAARCISVFPPRYGFSTKLGAKYSLSQFSANPYLMSNEGFKLILENVYVDLKPTVIQIS
jgi:hypothetical protein